MDSRSVPPLSPFNYPQWKLKMIEYLKSHDLFDISIGFVSEPTYYEQKCAWLNDYNKAYGVMCLAISPSMCYLIDIVDTPSELWKNLYRYLEWKMMGNM